MSAVAVDPIQIETFVGVLFRYASDGVSIALRSFYEGETKPFQIRAAKVNGAGVAGIVPAAVAMATDAAAAARAVVFCPPIAGFNNAAHPWKARREDLAEAYALSVECDATPAFARSTLESLLGPATVVVESGGEWTNPDTGEVEPKVHLHWRLTEPATGDDKGRLEVARRSATAIVGGDTTNVPSVHPIRWPGSIHRKKAARLAQIVSLNEGAEIDLAEAAELLEDRAQVAPRPAPKAGADRRSQEEHRGGGSAGPGVDGDHETLVANLVRGELLHDSIARLAAKMVASGMVGGAVVTHLRGLMEGSAARRDDRWQARFDDIPRAVSTAEAKYQREATEPAEASADEADFAPTGFTGEVPPARPWAYGDFLMEGAVTGIAAPPGVGKTTFSFQLGLAFSLDMDFGPWGPRPGGGGRVWLFNGEEPKDELDRRFLAACKEMGVTEGVVADRFRYNSGLARPLSLGFQDAKGKFVRSPDLERIKALIRAEGFKLFVLDPLIEFHDVKENDIEAFGRVGAVCREIASDCQCAVLIFHHTPKAANADTAAGDMNALRGGGPLIGVARFVLTMFSMTDRDAKELGVTAKERPSFVRFDNAKANMTAVNGGATWWRKVGVGIDNAEGVRPADVIGVLRRAHLQSAEVDPEQLAAQRASAAESETARLAREMVTVCQRGGHVSADTAIAITPLSNALNAVAIGMKATKARGVMQREMSAGFEVDDVRIVARTSFRGSLHQVFFHVEQGAADAV